MTDQLTQLKNQIMEHIQALPLDLQNEFGDTWEILSNQFSEEQLMSWAKIASVLVAHNTRASDAAIHYFKQSPKVASLMPFKYFYRWCQNGINLCQDSPSLAGSYFNASGEVMETLRSRHIGTWAGLGLSLYKGTWKSSTLSCQFFEMSSKLLKDLTISELGQLVNLLDIVASKSYDSAIECLVLGSKVFGLLNQDIKQFIEVCTSIASIRWRDVKGILEALGKSLIKIDVESRSGFMGLIYVLHEAKYSNLPAVMIDMSRSFGDLGKEHHDVLIKLSGSVAMASPLAMPEFIRSCTSVLERVDIENLRKWCEAGLTTLEENEDAGLAYFKLESSRSQDMVDNLSSGVEFAKIRALMEMYCRALAGSKVDVAPSEELAEKHIGWVSQEVPTTEGSTVFLPPKEDRYCRKSDNFALYKVIATHQVAHLEFGSFNFDYDKPSTMFQDMRPSLDSFQEYDGRLDNTSPSQDRMWITDMQRYFDLFDDRSLALDIFTVVEDGRLDSLVVTEYLGIKGDYCREQENALSIRPEPQSLPMREFLIELLVRISLSDPSQISVPIHLVEDAKNVIKLARMVQTQSSTIEDVAESTLRIYAIVSQISNDVVPPTNWKTIDLESNLQDSQLVDDEELIKVISGPGSELGSDQPANYEPVQNVGYRGDFKPELVQMINRLKSKSDSANTGDGDGQITQDMIEDLVEGSVELDLTGEGVSGRDDNVGAFAENLLKEAGLKATSGSEDTNGALVHVDENGNELVASGPQTFVYDEWDFRAADYKPNWTIVRQQTMSEGDPTYFTTTLNNYGRLAEEIKRQFQLVIPEMFRKVRKLEDGVEIDIDDAIEAFVDIRTGVSPSEKLYWKHNKVERDVSAVFLLDTSASTAEAIEDSKKLSDDWEAPKDPIEYMDWLRDRRGGGLKRSYKRIIDLEKEAVVLIIHALESVGDLYGIYGFSGYGRENVEFYTIKDIEESFSDQVQRRIDCISPLHATRMGPAIRHATSKLEAQDTRTKLLFLISDGRPQDRGYSREGVEKEYAIHDTRMALDEAADKGINAFCLTVDKNGHDYLKTMCQDMGYEVLDDIYSLPRRLLYLYRRLTV